MAEGSKSELPPEEKELEKLEKLEVNWVVPDLQKEEDEIKRVAEEQNLSEDKVRGAISRGVMQELTEQMWSRLENTESYDHVRPGHMEDAKKYSEKGQGRDWKALVEAMEKGRSILSPIILVKPDGKPHLVSGNTRLMISRVLDVTPQVFVAHMEEKENK